MRGVGGACKHIHHTLLNSTRVWGLAASVLKPRSPKNSWVPLRTPLRSYTCHHLPTILLMLEEWGREKGETNKKQTTRGRTSLAILYSKHWGMLRR
jgi:hypothetical protein